MAWLDDLNPTKANKKVKRKKRVIDWQEIRN